MRDSEAICSRSVQKIRELGNANRKNQYPFSVGESVTWLKKDSARADEIWCSFAGLDYLSIQHYSSFTESENLIKALFPTYLELFSLRPDFLCGLRPFTYLMLNKASGDIRLESLGIVAKAIKDKNLSDCLGEDSVSLLSS